MLAEVSRAAHAFEDLGVEPGDRVVIYLPVIPETIVATLACARIGAVHSLVFGGFSAEALRFRIEDTGAKVLVTTDGQFRRGTAVPVKANADAASFPWTPGRDLWWHQALADRPTTHTPRFFDAEHPLFIIYTSGTTGKPKGLVHTTGGYLTQTAYTHALLFDLLPDGDELAATNDPQKVADTVHWCTADLAWVTAHTYEIYGPLLNGVTQVIYEGTPQTPHPGRHFEIIERYGVTTYYTAPTLIRSHMSHFPDGLPAHTPAGWDLSSLRLLGTVGESINPEAWRWIRRELGGDRLPVVDTWWQSETGSCVMSPRPRDTAWDAGTAKPGCATRALPGLSTRVVDEAGAPVPTGDQGYLVVDRLGPSMARTVWGDPERYLTSYFRDYAARGWFFSGDGAKQDADGDLHLLGRVDDVINVSGHRLSTIELESALLTHPDVVEAGTAPVTHELTGQAAVAFVVLSTEAQRRLDAGALDPAGLEATLRAHVAHEIGPVAKPARVVAVPAVPKTRSGKIMRRLLTQLHEGTALRDTTSLQNEESVSAIAAVVGHPSARPPLPRRPDRPPFPTTTAGPVPDHGPTHRPPTDEQKDAPHVRPPVRVPHPGPPRRRDARFRTRRPCRADLPVLVLRVQGLRGRREPLRAAEIRQHLLPHRQSDGRRPGGAPGRARGRDRRGRDGQRHVRGVRHLRGAHAGR